jgi:hypothetical protein
LVAPSELPLLGPEPESFLVLLPQAETPTKLNESAIAASVE